MIVKDLKSGIEYVAYAINYRRQLECLDVNILGDDFWENKEDYCCLPRNLDINESVLIIDFSIPDNWILSIEWYGYTLRPKSLAKELLINFNDINFGPNSYEMMEFIKSANETRRFHNLPEIPLPEYLLPEPTEEERRQKTMNDELEEYLRIAEKYGNK